jgi:hypothetical protein
MFQPTAQRVLTAEQIRYIALAHGFGIILCVLAFWGFWLLSLVANYFGLVYTTTGGQELPSRVILWMAVIVSALGALLFWPRFSRALLLSRRGRVEVGTVRRRLGVTWRGIETILVSYTVDDHAYAIKLGESFRTFAVGDRVRLAFDPEKPQRAMLADQVFDGKVGS